ncbi:hypothetical protein WJX84_012220 [Apatococcus fuscideae]|uniref:Fe2OG dioxygenase domain-containing protein n=1 Tax=Apatococcus fuscideae TaxID=2026836 RepID=A0AAW1SRX7_9CHLO
MATEVATPFEGSFATRGPGKTLLCSFEPSRDLSQAGTDPRRWSLTDLGYEQGKACSPFGVCEPFQLLNPIFVAQLKTELMGDAVQQNCRFSTNRTPCCLRGVAEHSQLVNQLWTSEETTRRISEVVGTPLKPIFNYEKGICNVQVPSDGDSKRNVDDWHTDSYPVVAIVLLSNPSPGGETCCMTTDGNELPLQFPTAGSCIVLQGSAVKHCARRVLSENPVDARITMVTSYVPADPMAPDCSILRGPRTNSDLEVLYCQWAEYRLASLASKVTTLSQGVADTRRAKGRLTRIEVKDLQERCQEMMSFLSVTAQEMQF